MDNKNLNIYTNDEGNFRTDDEFLNSIIKQSETEGNPIQNLVSAISFDESEPVADRDDGKLYLVLYTFNESDSRSWNVKYGRQATYNYLRNLIISETLDPNKSFIIAVDSITNDEGNEDCKVKTAPITVFRFMKVMAENEMVVENTDFDIDAYHDDTAESDYSIFDI